MNKAFKYFQLNEGYSGEKYEQVMEGFNFIIIIERKQNATDNTRIYAYQYVILSIGYDIADYVLFFLVRLNDKNYEYFMRISIAAIYYISKIKIHKLY